MNSFFNEKNARTCVFFFLLFLYSGIIINLFFIQVYHYLFFTHLATQQHTLVVKQAPARALIYDRNNVALAVNKIGISAFIMPHMVKNKEVLRLFLEAHFPHSPALLHADTKKSFIFVKRKITDEEKKCIEDSEIKDIHFMKECHRFYPFDACGSLVGITDIDNKGALAIEQIYNSHLQGQPTTFLLQKDARSGYFYLKKEVQTVGCEGKPITLTIDAQLQFLINQEFLKAVNTHNALSGSVVVMDPFKGDILASVSFPSFDPNQSRTLVMEHTKNNGLVYAYEPGSVMKIFLALAAFDHKVVAFDELIDCHNTRTATVGGRQVNTWKACGVMPFYDVIAYSNNIGIALIAQRLGTYIFDHYKRLGFGVKPTMLFPAQPTGFVNQPACWSKQSAISLSYGYELMTTPLQIARACAVLINGGFLVEPRLVMDDPITVKGPLYKPQDLAYIQAILKRVTEYGTTKRASLKGYEIRAKTGSASTLVEGKYVDDIGNYTCAGILSKDNYHRVIVVHMHIPHSKKKYAATLVAPVFKKIAETLVVHDRIV